jgi:hypothetical protein
MYYDLNFIDYSYIFNNFKIPYEFKNSNWLLNTINRYIENLRYFWETCFFIIKIYKFAENLWFNFDYLNY